MLKIKTIKDKKNFILIMFRLIFNNIIEDDKFIEFIKTLLKCSLNSKDFSSLEINYNNSSLKTNINNFDFSFLYNIFCICDLYDGIPEESTLEIEFYLQNEEIYIKLWFINNRTGEIKEKINKVSNINEIFKK